MTKAVLLRDIAKVIRSKNAGPFEMTMDIVFKDQADYQRVKDLGIISHDLVSRLYGVDKERIVALVFFDTANAIKITIPRLRPQGSIGETDMHAAQQHVPLMNVEIPW